MRIWTPYISSQRLQFRNTFFNLQGVLGGGGIVFGSVSIDRGADLSGGGYIIFANRGADELWQLPAWSVFVDVDVPASGSQRVLVACANPGVPGARFEFGTSTTNQLYLTGGSTVTSDDVLTEGHHKVGAIYTGGVLEFWADGVRIGSTVVTLSTGWPNTVYVGVAADGASRKLGSTIYKLDVYNYPLDENEAFGVSAIEGWTPRSLLTDYGGTYDNGLYLDGDEPGAYELNTSANIVNPDFDSGVTGWSVYQSTIAQVAGGPNGLANFVRMTATGAGTASTMYQSVGIVGNRYTASLYASRRTTNSYRVDLGNASVLSGSNTDWAFKEGEGTWAGDTNLRVTSFPNSGYADFARIRLQQRSCKGLFYYGSGTLAGTKFAQANPANMGWKSSDGLGVRCDGVSDSFVSSASAAVFNFLHEDSGSLAMLMSTDSANAGYFSTCGIVSPVGQPGLAMYKIGANIYLITSNGAVYTVNQTVGASTGQDVVEFHHTATTWEVYLNGAYVNNGAAAFGGGNAAGSAVLGSTLGGSVYMGGAIRKVAAIEGELTSPEKLQLRNYLLRAKR